MGPMNLPSKFFITLGFKPIFFSQSSIVNFYLKSKFEFEYKIYMHSMINALLPMIIAPLWALPFKPLVEHVMMMIMKQDA